MGPLVWGVPIGTHQGVSHPLAAAKVEVELARLMTDKAAWLHDHDAGDVLSQRIRGVKAVEAAGGEVLVVAGDVTDADAMTNVVKATKARFGPIRGVVHAAGIPAHAFRSRD